ncbi:MAG: hypothetical protein HOD35_05005 [Euryarchaeota archaeon]|nr:hypothetical protein [Euryarchaeota archaeon]
MSSSNTVKNIKPASDKNMSPSISPFMVGALFTSLISASLEVKHPENTLMTIKVEITKDMPTNLLSIDELEATKVLN